MVILIDRLFEKGVRELKSFKKNKEFLSRMLVIAAFVAVVFSFIGWVGTDFWLASTQWLLVAMVLALFGVYFQKQ